MPVQVDHILELKKGVKMSPIVKKILQILVPALLGSGITIAITEGVVINCKPVIETSK